MKCKHCGRTIRGEKRECVCTSGRNRKYALQTQTKFLPAELNHLSTLIPAIPQDKDKHITQPFMHFPIGTHVNDIWEWFVKEFNFEGVMNPLLKHGCNKQRKDETNVH